MVVLNVYRTNYKPAAFIATSIYLTNCNNQRAQPPVGSLDFSNFQNRNFVPSHSTTQFHKSFSPKEDEVQQSVTPWLFGFIVPFCSNSYNQRNIACTCCHKRKSQNNVLQYQDHPVKILMSNQYPYINQKMVVLPTVSL